MSLARFAFQACSLNRIAAPLPIPRQNDRGAAGQYGYTESRLTDIFDVPHKSFSSHSLLQFGIWLLLLPMTCFVSS